MNFETFIRQAWSDHASDAEAVAMRLHEGKNLLEKSEQIIPLANLATHLFGEHLGQWKEGLSFLAELRASPTFIAGSETESALKGFTEALNIACGAEPNSKLDRGDRIRALAIAASALSGQGNAERAHHYFRQSLDLAQLGLEKSDPANRALAVAGNNLACALEEKLARTPAETELMILAAETGRKYWEIAGTWLEVERAEYRLAKTYIKARELQKALEHAEACLKIASENKAPALELFFGYEALAIVEKSRNNMPGFETALNRAQEFFNLLSDEDKSWCKASLEKLK